MPSCLGAGLVSLDVILNGSPATLPKLSAGGSCGNVLSILGYLNWDSYPIARLANNRAGTELLQDLVRWNIHVDYITQTDEGSTPIIIHRIMKDKEGTPIHRFEFRDPVTKSWLPPFKAITKHKATEVIASNFIPQVFYFDRINPGTYLLASYFKSKGSIIYFEPSSIKDTTEFNKFLALADIVKFSTDRITDYKDRYASNQCFLEIETRGKAGLLYRCKNSPVADQWNGIKAFPLAQIKDAAGAGDWCTAGIISQLCSQGRTGLFDSTVKQLGEAMQFGQALGALNCLFDGARGPMYYFSSGDFIELTSSLVAGSFDSSYCQEALARVDISMNIHFADLYESNL